jgi:predicted kinase
MLVAIGGLSGTGKSILARSLASLIKPEPGAVVLRSDVERKRLAGVRETDPLPSESYTRESSRRVYARLREKAEAVLRCGHSVIVDAVHAAPDERLEIERVAAATGAAFKGLFLTADLRIRENRTVGRRNDASDATAATVLSQEAYDLGHIAWAEVDASGTPSQTLEKARIGLNRKAS